MDLIYLIKTNLGLKGHLRVCILNFLRSELIPNRKKLMFFIASHLNLGLMFSSKAREPTLLVESCKGLHFCWILALSPNIGLGLKCLSV